MIDTHQTKHERIEIVGITKPDHSLRIPVIVRTKFRLPKSSALISAHEEYQMYKKQI